jgi:hypothetical protein
MHQREILDRIKDLPSMLQQDMGNEVYGRLNELIGDLERNVADPKISNIHDSKKPIILVDFDGVIHSYRSGWKGVNVIPDPPVTGALIWLMGLTDKFDVRIFSARCNDTAGIAAMISWFREWGLSDDSIARLKFEPGKPSAYLIIDDRAVQFPGHFDDLTPGSLFRFKPWYYAHKAWNR